MGWNYTTDIGRRWFQTSGANVLSQNSSETYEDYIRLYEQDPTEEKNFDTDIRSGRTDPVSYFWELREILEHTT